MLLMTLCCEDEKNLIKDMQNIKNVLKSKGIIIGVSESISYGTHFVKIYYGNSEFDENMRATIMLYISNVIYNVIVEHYREKEMLHYINENYFFLKHDEILDIDLAINKILKGDQKICSDKDFYCLNKINDIIENIKEFILENDYINIEGFITFRMKNFLKDIECIIDKVVEDYMIEKEYNEFIKLLKYFVDIQDCKLEEVNIIVQKNGSYEVKDSKGLDIFKDFLNEITDAAEVGIINTEDIIISGLITNVPKKIKIYNEEYCINKEFIQTIKSVFGERVETHRSYNNILKK
ncbi:YtxC-like family protein [Clostridium perfringens NCTC 8239]|uniref:putative sporulation protein YtxC n=1 Tax=Clostridium perfringens TaxID=1502 RepID=UPI0011DCE8B1|nr:putative sporulation protein YtxC [Clostridium perfringens]MDH5060195.1 YtxC-like family protein [Clostridium perfringens NCTC 8239]CAG9348831.1 sporulation protein YtxC [Clostridium perfringens NCTC 8239]HAT4230963.1 putative sporulation protein YtxC [Clostridium perfringens]HAT4239837.1 putative sporulation protein YtxC [Clostridium perfringens]HAT4277433.1 putative sporulation protein YtxC [Clostridium perfringens]